jgi:putative membrane protein
MDELSFIPYCGAPPIPGTATWNLEPHLLMALAATGAAYALGTRRASVSSPECLCFVGGWLVLSLALVSPLCSLSVALFSARVGQHMLMSLVAAPLLVLGGVDRLLLSIFGFDDKTPRAGECAAATTIFAVALWVWHLPAPYDATFSSDVTYWLMHVTLLAAALFLWRVILRAPPGSMLLASGITGMQMCGLGAILALSTTPLFSVHLATTWPWGLTPAQDQSAGGLIMWVPGGLILTLEAIFALGRYLNLLDQLEA